MIELTDTNAAGIASALMHARKSAGSPAMGMVMTLVVVVDEDDAPDAMESARAASQEHPARVLGVILGDARGKGSINAQVGIGSGWSGEHALIRLKGEVVQHPESVVLPLLLPDSPSPAGGRLTRRRDPAADPLGSLAQRRITDSAAARRAPHQGTAPAVCVVCHQATPTSPGHDSPRGGRCSRPRSTSTRRRCGRPL